MTFSLKHFARRGFARIRCDVKKIYEVDPLRCPACPGTMRIVAFINDTAVIYRILKHLDLLGKDPPILSIRGPPATGTG